MAVRGTPAGGKVEQSETNGEARQGLASGPPARLGRALRAGARAAWDRLGLVMALSLTFALLLCIPMTVAGLLAALPAPARNGLVLAVAALTLSAPMAGAYFVAHLISTYEEVSYADMWRGAKRMFGPATRLGLIQCGVLSVLAVNLWFYVSIGHLLGGVAALLCLYALLAWGMMAVYHFPLLVAQETGLFDEPGRQARRGALAVLRRAFFLAFGSPFFSAGLLAIVLAFSALVAATVALIPLLWLGVVAMLTTQATHALLIQYGVLPAPAQEEVVPDEKFRIADGEKSFRQEEQN
jgi:uncharacterized membrane protein YesL